MKEAVSLEEYKRAEKVAATVEGRRGLLVHAWVTGAVVIGLVVINVLVASEFPWSIFPAIGMTIGLGFHYMGIRNLSREVETRQSHIEDEASRLSA